MLFILSSILVSLGVWKEVFDLVKGVLPTKFTECIVCPYTMFVN